MSASPPPEPLRPPRPAHVRRAGGAWKVAYADFVTALMALFIVLWLMNSSDKVKQSVSGYFHDPTGFSRLPGAGPANAGEGLAAHSGDLKTLQKRIEEALRQVPEFQRMRDHVRLSVTGDGLRVELLETDDGLFFVTGSPAPTGDGARLLAAIAAELGRMPNSIVIEGHTDARPFRNAAPATGYGNWELSVDRANAARRLLHAQGLPPQRVVEVRGFADQRPFVEADRNDPRNRRVSIVVKLAL